MYRRIIAPIDGSETSNLGLLEAIKLAKEPGAKLRLLNVVDVAIVTASLDSSTNANELIELLRRNGEKILEEAAAAAARRGVKTDKTIAEAIEERTAEVIVQEARRWRADLIVMGTHGRRGFNRMFLGSDAEGVVRMSSVPVLLVRAKPERRTRGKPKTRGRRI